MTAAKSEISDLTNEYNEEKRELLETTRKQQQQMKLQQQMLDRMAQLVRRDCNYSNFEKVMAQVKHVHFMY